MRFDVSGRVAKQHSLLTSNADVRLSPAERRIEQGFRWAELSARPQWTVGESAPT